MRIIETQLGETLQGIIANEGIDLDDPSLYFLLPDIPAIIQAENLFLKRNGLWRERLLTFGKLSFLSNLKYEERLNVISRLGRLFLMEEIVDELGDGFSYFGKNHTVKGFSDSLLKLIAELKHAKISSQNLFYVAENLVESELKGKLRDIVKVVESYQSKLKQERLIDDIDKLKLLSETIKAGKLSNVLPNARKFFVFGFFDFTPSQLEVLKSIDDSEFELSILITTFDESQGLKSIFTDKVRPWFGEILIEYMPAASGADRVVEIHSFPSFRQEAEFSAREIKRLMLYESIKPNEIAIVTRTLADREKFIVKACERHGIPYSISTELSLKTTILGQFVLTLLRVKSSGFERNHLFKLLRSPLLAKFFNYDDVYEFISLLDVESRRRRTLKGSKAWIDLLNVFEDSWYHLVERVKKLVIIIDSNFRSLNLGKLADDLSNVMDDLIVYKTVEELSECSNIYAPSWDNFSKFIKEIRYLSKYRFKNSKVEALNDFISLLKDLWTEETFSFSTPGSIETIQILDALESRGTSFPIVFIIDVGEKSFPLPLFRDPILKNEERVYINDFFGTRYLYEENHHEQSEEYLFKMVCSSARRKLYVTYSFMDDRERKKLPSYLVEDLKEELRIEPLKHSLDDSFCKPENVFTKTEFSRHLFLKFRSHDFEIMPYCGYLPENIFYVLNGLKAERIRMELYGYYSEFEGKIKRKELLPELNDYSPTGLETYGDCPFRYFAGNILGLKEPEQVEDDLSGLDLGYFYHRVLRDFFDLLSKKMNGRVDLRRIGDEEIEEEFWAFKDRVNFDEVFPWLSLEMRKLIERRVKERVLPNFVISELNRVREGNFDGFFPSFFERDLDFNLRDSKLTGRIDRVDIGDKGALVIDYKLRSSSKRKFFDYQNLQLPLYLYAIRQQGLTPYGGYFRFIEQPELEIGLEDKGKESIEDALNSVEDIVEMYVGLMKEGFFSPVIKEKSRGFEREEIELIKDEYATCGWCEFRDLCRVRGGTFRKL